VQAAFVQSGVDDDSDSGAPPALLSLGSVAPEPLWMFYRAAAAKLPLSRVLPPLITLRLRSRVYRWYAHLRSLEAELDGADADLASLSERLEQLDRQTEKIGVPLACAHELYDLRAHIHGVRKRLAQRQAGAQPAAS
jgi:hypothetical protein